MDRRDVLKLIGLATGSALIGGELLFSACTRDDTYRSTVFSPESVRLLEGIAETILPRTNTPGAKDARVAPFMTKIVDHCYSENEQHTFHTGLTRLDAECQARFGEPFLRLTPEQKTTFLSELDGIARAYRPEDNGTRHYFTLMKQLTLFAFFTSEVGQTKVLRHVPVPGRYDGCYPYKDGDAAWAI